MACQRWFLKDECDSATVNLAQFPIAGLEKIFTLKQYGAAADMAVRRKKPQHRRRKRAFPRTGFAKNAEDFSGHQVEAHSRQNRTRADFARPIGNLKILDIQNG